ncbi:MAG: glycosyltransferase [Nodosilinea sp.]
MNQDKFPGTIFQVFPPVIRESGGELSIDIDLVEALQLYLESFERVILACPVGRDGPDSSLKNCIPIDSLPAWASNLEIVPLPEAYKIRDFARHFSNTRKLLRHHIQNAQYLEFFPCSLVGSWAGLACYEAMQLGRPYVVLADIVYHERMLFALQDKPFWKRWIKEKISINLFKKYHQHILKQSSLAILRGQEVYDEYASFCHRPHQIYHVTIAREDKIPTSLLEQKIAKLMSGRPLNISYAGRLIPIKGPLDWVRALHKAIDHNVDIRSVWLGDGSLLAEAQALAETLGISQYIDFAGFVTDKNQLLKTLRESDIFLFCHKSRESPRCLIEALGSGCALVGYEGEYPKDLTETHGGALLVPVEDWEALGDLIIELDRDRSRLATLIRSAYKTGTFYEKEAAYMHHINLIRDFYSKLYPHLTNKVTVEV